MLNIVFISSPSAAAYEIADIKPSPPKDSHGPCAARSDAAGAVYVDNFAVLSTDPDIANQKLDTIVKAFRGLGFVCHELAQATTEGEFVGLSISKNAVSTKRSRIWRLQPTKSVPEPVWKLFSATLRGP